MVSAVYMPSESTQPHLTHRATDAQTLTFNQQQRETCFLFEGVPSRSISLLLCIVLVYTSIRVCVYSSVKVFLTCTLCKLRTYCVFYILSWYIVLSIPGMFHDNLRQPAYLLFSPHRSTRMHSQMRRTMRDGERGVIMGRQDNNNVLCLYPGHIRISKKSKSS